MEEEVIGTSFTYHRPSCHTIRNSYGLRFQSWIEAVSEGLNPCRVCYPHFSPMVEIVIGADFTYHRPDCRVLDKGDRNLMKRFQSWDRAVSEGLNPCKVCDPVFIPLEEKEVIGGMFTYHRLHCPCLEHIAAKYIDRYQSWEKAQAQGKRPCVLCLPSSLILKEEPTPPNPLPTKELKPSSEDVTKETIGKITDPTKILTPQIDDSNQTLDVKQLSDLRRRLIRLVGKLDQLTECPAGEGIASKISRLMRENVIPRDVAPFMRTVTEMRNLAEYESKSLSSSESKAVRAAWKVIEEWAQGKQIEL